MELTQAVYLVGKIVGNAAGLATTCAVLIEYRPQVGRRRIVVNRWWSMLGDSIGACSGNSTGACSGVRLIFV